MSKERRAAVQRERVSPADEKMQPHAQERVERDEAGTKRTPPTEGADEQNGAPGYGDRGDPPH